MLFGLATIQFARHPEGLVEHGKRTAGARVEAILSRRRGDPKPEGHPEPGPVLQVADAKEPAP